MGATRYDDVARAFGGHGVVARGRAALDAALREAFARDTFTLIACPIEASQYVSAF